MATRITESDFQRPKEIAAAFGKSLATLLREALALYVDMVFPLVLLARRGDEAQGDKARREDPKHAQPTQKARSRQAR